jgi:hypothetical protein
MLRHLESNHKASQMLQQSVTVNLLSLVAYLLTCRGLSSGPADDWSTASCAVWVLISRKGTPVTGVASSPSVAVQILAGHCRSKSLAVAIQLVLQAASRNGTMVMLV